MIAQYLVRVARINTDSQSRAWVKLAVVSTGEAPNKSILIPESQPKERWIALLIFLLTASYLFLFRRFATMDPDEGIILQGAQRILRGEVLYRDFFSFFTPGSYYLLAALFKTFGNSLMVARTALVVFGGVFSVVTYLLARRVCRRSSAFTVACIVSLTSLPYRFMALHNWDSTLWACLAVYSCVRMIESRAIAWAVAGGTFTSLTFLFEQSKGGGLALGLGVGLLTISLIHRTQPAFTKASFIALLAGAAWPMIGTLVWFYAKDSLQPMFSAWLWPLDHYSLANRVPYGYQNWSDATRQSFFGGPLPDAFFSFLVVSPLLFVPLLPLLALAQLGYWIVRMRRRTVSPEKGCYYVLISSALSGLLVSVIIVRADNIHFIYMQPLFSVVLAWIFDGRDIPGQLFRKVKPLITAYLVAAFFLMSAAVLVRSVAGVSVVETARGAITVRGEDTVIEYVRRHVSPGETVLVHPYLPLYYYLTETFSPGRYEYLQPGLHSPEQFQEMVGTLSMGKVRTVLLELSFSEKIPTSWPNTPISAILKDPVSDYVLQHYRTCKVLHSPEAWRFLFLIRKELECPGA
jgi:4-amino-4-deoxy-L-arabinose transferase-like glycosyltransferase